MLKKWFGKVHTLRVKRCTAIWHLCLLRGTRTSRSNLHQNQYVSPLNTSVLCRLNLPKSKKAWSRYWKHYYIDIFGPRSSRSDGRAKENVPASTNMARRELWGTFRTSFCVKAAIFDSDAMKDENRHRMTLCGIWRRRWRSKARVFTRSRSSSERARRTPRGPHRAVWSAGSEDCNSVRCCKDTVSAWRGTEKSARCRERGFRCSTDSSNGDVTGWSRQR